MYLSIYLSVCLSVCLSIHPSIYRSPSIIDLSIYRSVIYPILSVFLSTYLFVYLCTCLSINLSIYLPVYLSICLSICLSFYLSFFIPFFQSFCVSDLSVSIVFLCLVSACVYIYISVYFFCETYFKFGSWQHEKRSNSARRPSKMETPVLSRQLRANAFCNFSKVLRLPPKSKVRSCKVLHVSRAIILGNLKIWCSRKQPLSACTASATQHACLQILFKRPTPAIVVETWQNLTFHQVENPLRVPHKTPLECPKVVRTCVFFIILTSKCASRHSGVHFLNISASKIVPIMVCFLRFDFEKRASRHSRVHCFDISTSKSVRTWGVFAILISTCASRRDGAQFFLSHTTRWLRGCHISEPTFRQDIGKTQCSWFFYFFARLHLLFSILCFSFFFLSLPWLFPPLLFHLSTLSEIWLLNFLRWTLSILFAL